MALNKRKVLDAARKHAQKGAKEKALKEYGKLLKEDSRDAKLLLEIGDSHRRWGQNEEAISHYTKVAEQYKQGGFDARAVAVFKQIINLDTKRYGAFVSLAELYQRMGLDAEAANALQTAADGYHKEGRKSEALELLRKMATLDPSNTTSRMKVADLLRQEEMLDDAISEYEAVAEELVRQGATDQLVPVYERVLEVRPERDDVSFALARALVQLSDASRAEPYARRAFDAKPDAEGYFDLLNGIYVDLDKTEELTDVTRQMAQVYRSQGDDSRARELMQRLPGDDALSLDDESEAAGSDATGATAGDSVGAGTSDEELLDDDFLDDDFLADDGEGDSDEDSFIDIGDDDDDALELDMQADDDTALDDVALDDPVIDDPADDDSEGLPEGDPDQLFAEASVYLRYGKRDQAITSLEAILVQEPRHRDALEKLGECYADAGDAPRAVDYWKQAAELASNAHDEAALDVLRERIAVLDPDAAAELTPSPVVAAAAEPEVTDMDDEIELDLDVDFDEDADEVSAVEPDVGDDPLDESLEDLGDDDVSEIEVDVDLDDAIDEIDVEIGDDLDVELTADVAVDEDVEDATDPEASFTDETSAAADDSAASIEIDLDDEEDEIELGGFDSDDVTANEPPSEQSATAAASIDTQKVAEDLEEAEFYVAQELFDEAEAIYKRILESCPNHPSAMVRLGELQAARGEDPGASAPPVDDADELTLDPSELPFEEEDSADDEAPDAAEMSADEIEVELDLDADVEVDVTGDDEDEDEVSLGENSELEIAVELDDESLADESDDASSAIELDAAADVTGDDDEEDEGIDLSDESLELANEDEAVCDASAADHAAADNTMPLVQADAFDGADEEPEVIELADDVEVGVDLAVEFEDEDAADEEPEEVESISVAEEDDETDDAAVSAEATQEDEDDSFDLAAELRESLEDDDDDEDVAAVESAEPTSEEEGFASIFKDFKSGVEKTLGEGDYETRFDLGIAYRGMELFDDALGEFRICLDSPGHRLESLHMMGLCAIDLGRFSDATNHLEQALASEDVPEPKQAGLRFDLGRAFEGAEDFARAKDSFEAARAIDDSIPSLDECIERLAVRISGEDEGEVELAEASSTQGEGGFESFDDLVAEVEAEEDGESEAETFESFDDVVAEVEAGEAVIETAEPVGDDDADSNQNGSAADNGGDDKPKRRKKKRISFV